MKLIITPGAESDLEAIGDFIARDNPRRAISFSLELRARCRELVRFPNRFPIAGRVAGSVVRRCVHGRYLIFYRVDEDAVRVLHFLNGAVDYAALFDEID